MKKFSQTLIVLAACGVSSLHAGTFVAATPDPFGSPGFGFGIPGGGLSCTPTLCTGNNTSHDYQYVSKSFAGGDEIAHLTATFSGTFYETDGTKIGDYSGEGNVDFEFFGRGSETTGTWNAQLLRDDFSVSLGGHTLSLMLDPSNPSTGQLSVTAFQSLNDNGSGGDLFLIETSFDVVHALFTVDPTLPGGFTNAPFAFPLQEGDLSAPEPSGALLLLSPLAGLVYLRRRAGAAK